MEGPTKITFAEMREMDVRGLLVYCADYRCRLSSILEDEITDAGAVERFWSRARKKLGILRRANIARDRPGCY